MTQAGRQGSPRSSSGRNGSGRTAGPRTGAQRNAGQRDFSKGGGDRPFKQPRPREERFIDPDEQPTGSAPAGRGTDAAKSGDWKTGAKPSARKPAARKPGAGKTPGTPGALKPKPRTGGQNSAGPRAFGSERLARTLGRCGSPPASGAPATKYPSQNSTMPTASGCRRSWLRPASPPGGCARR